MMKSWSSSQPVVSRRSCEAELHALTKAATQAKGLASLMLDFDMDVNTVVHTDSTAALGILIYNIFVTGKCLQQVYFHTEDCNS